MKQMPLVGGVFLVACLVHNNISQGIYSWNRKTIPIMITVSADAGDSDMLPQRGLLSIMLVCLGAYYMGTSYQDMQKDRVILDNLQNIATMCAGGLIFSRGILLFKQIWDKLTMKSYPIKKKVPYSWEPCLC